MNRSRLFTVIGTVAVLAAAAASLAGSASASTLASGPQPLNAWDGNPQTFSVQAFPNDCARIDNAKSGYPSGALIIGTGSCTKFQYSFGWLIDVNNSKCLFYDNTGARDGIVSSFDLGTCANVASDVWESASGNNYSMWYTTYLALATPPESMWEVGTGTSNPCEAKPQNGNNSGDRWHAAG